MCFQLNPPYIFIVYLSVGLIHESGFFLTFIIWKNIAIICAGTSDLKVAEEAAVTAEVMGSKVHRIYDVGVAGIHRLFNYLEEIQNATQKSCMGIPAIGYGDIRM